MNYYKPKTISLINAQQTATIQSTKQWILFTAISVICTVIFLSLPHVTDITQWYTQRKAIAQLQNRLHNAQPAYEKYQTLVKQKETITKHQEKIAHYQHHENRPIHLLNNLISLSPKKLSYNQLSIRKKNITVDFSALDMQTIHAFIGQLSNEKMIKNVRVASIHYDNDNERYTCSLHAKVEKKHR